jgi:putative ATP-grasp target RiPP
VDFDRFSDDPMVPHSPRFPLSRGGVTSEPNEEPSPAGIRPWGLRRMAPVEFTGTPTPANTYDPVRQIRVDLEGRPLMEMGPPTADKTGSMDGSEGDPSEDFNND